MKTTRRYVLVSLGATALAMLFACQKYVDYVPLVAVDDRTQWRYQARPELLSDEHVAAMIALLEEYGKRYRMHDGRLQIAEDLAEDRNLLSNLTAKAIAAQEANSGKEGGD